MEETKPSALLLYTNINFFSEKNINVKVVANNKFKNKNNIIKFIRNYYETETNNYNKKLRRYKTLLT